MMATAIVTTTTYRAKRRELERRARQRRLDRLEAMRRTRAALERTIVAAHTLGHDDAAWEDFLDADVARLRRSLAVTKEAIVLARQNALYTRLLEEHQLATDAISDILRENAVAGWDHDVARWYELSQRRSPWTVEACRDEIDAALKHLNAFQWSTEKQSTGARVFGWRDARRVDPVNQTMDFEFYKTFRGDSMMSYVNTLWDAFTSDEVYQDVIVGRGNLSVHEVLQQLAPNIALVRTSSRNPDLGVDTHYVYLVFRVQTDRGFAQCVQSVICPELIHAIAEPQDVWPSNSTWIQVERVGNDEAAYVVRIGGSLRGTDVTYAKKWFFEILECVVRIEFVATGQGLIAQE